MIKPQIITVKKFLEGHDCTCLAVITIDSALKEDENYYPQAFLKECRFKEKELISNITEDIESFPSEYDE